VTCKKDASRMGFLTVRGSAVKETQYVCPQACIGKFFTDHTGEADKCGTFRSGSWIAREGIYIEVMDTKTGNTRGDMTAGRRMVTVEMICRRGYNSLAG